MKKLVSALLAALSCLLSTSAPAFAAKTITDAMLGQMIMACFDGTSLKPDAPIMQAVRAGRVGGVILFDIKRHGAGVMNITSVKQTAKLVRTLREAAPGRFLIAVDQEGGTVRRLHPKHGFRDCPSAARLGRGKPQATQADAFATGRELAAIGINVDFAPVADVNVNPDCPIIGKRQRAFSSDPKVCAAHALAYGRGLAQAGVIPALKHFPGHGSSTKDSHWDFVDITKTWTEAELIPYREAFAQDWPGMVMTNHLYNANIDDKYPASLSRAAVQGLLREKLGFEGVVVSDSLLMRAVTDHYTLEETVELVVTSGTDIVLAASNDPPDPKLHERVFAVLRRLADEGKLTYERVKLSNDRIAALYDRFAKIAPQLYPHAAADAKPVKTGKTGTEANVRRP